MSVFSSRFLALSRVVCLQLMMTVCLIIAIYKSLNNKKALSVIVERFFMATVLALANAIYWDSLTRLENV